MSEGGKIIDLMDEGKLFEIRTPSRIFHNTPDDKFLLTLEFGISKKDSDDKSVAVKRGLEKKLRDGWRPGVAPVGYLNDKVTESGFRRILTDTERFPFIKKIFHLFYEEHISVIEIQRISKDDWHFRTRQKRRSGGKPLTVSMIYWILTNPFYCGKFEYPKGSGRWHAGGHEKAIGEEIFDGIQHKLGRKSPYKLKGHDFSFSGLMRCGICDSGVVAEEKWQVICKSCKLKFPLTRKNQDHCTRCNTLIANMDNPKILHYIYYRCGKKKNRYCLEKSVRVDRLEEQVMDKLELLNIPTCFMEWAIEQVHKLNESEKEVQKATVDTTEKEYNNCKLKLQNLLQLKISPANSDGSMLSDADYKEQKLSFEAELKNIEKQRSGTSGDIQEANDKTIRALSFAIRAREKFRKGGLQKKREIFMGLGLNPKLQERKVLFDSPKYLSTIQKMKDDIENNGGEVEPSNKADKSSQMDAFFSSIPTLLRGWELNPAYKIMSLMCTVHYPAAALYQLISLWSNCYNLEAKRQGSSVG